MQKVSKQSLAMIALSILLAISIALTFTFAALADKKTATGTITFSGNVALEFSGSAIDSSGKITIGAVSADATAITTALSNAKFKLSSASQAAYIKVTANVDVNGNGDNAVTLTQAELTGWTKDTDTKVMTYKDNKLAANTEVALGSLFTANVNTSALVANTTGDIPNITITFTIEADTKNDFVASGKLS